MTGTRPRKAIIIGAGPVGALTALSLDNRGWDVEVWESREDPRGLSEEVTNLRSINLAISSRGLEALRSVDPSLAEEFLNEAIPMKGRMIHHVDGKEESQIYDPIRNQCINSISRPILNQRLIESLRTLSSSVEIHFSTKLSRVDFSSRTAWGASVAKAGAVPGQEKDNGRVGGGTRGEGKGKAKMVEDEEGTPFDLIIGCDGSWSKVRSEMMRVERLDFAQSFIQHAYIELHMPADPSKADGYAIDRNHLHIWPRHDFMLIGLPNKDGSFTLTLFLPFSSLENLDTRDKAAAFFTDNFPSAVNIVGVDRLVKDFESNPRGNLVTINVSPSSWSSHALLLGDASHSMVPFYGQGLNCGLEDVRVFNAFLERHDIKAETDIPLGQVDPQLTEALRDFTTRRDSDLRAICDLALENYTEMRSKVLSPLHHLRRHLDSLLSMIFPSRRPAVMSLTDAFPTRRVQGWTSLYEMVTFRPDVGYSEALRREQWQKRVVGVMGWGSGIGVIGLAGWAGVVAWRIVLRSSASRR